MHARPRRVFALCLALLSSCDSPGDSRPLSPGDDASVVDLSHPDVAPIAGVDGPAASTPDGSTPGFAAWLDGSNWVDLPRGSFYMTAAGFTWELWFNATSVPTDSTPTGEYPRPTSQYLFTVADGAFCEDALIAFGVPYGRADALSFVVDSPGACRYRDAAPIGYVPAGGFQNGRWYHVAAVRDVSANWVGLYLDGALVASKSSTVSPLIKASFAASVGRFFYGTSPVAGGAHLFKGAIDEVRVYERPLGASEVRDHYNGGKGRYGSASEPGLVAGWHLDETSGTGATDFGPNHLDGNYVNSPGHVPGVVFAP